ncbi:MAG: UDP-3-O-acyl-N-acetylglucosamine deacetylase [Armatimonadota bacterium]|nr:UDP-3-O-acyl-N-acetylglucosamine deacetylase [Armatimonadota bacterium]
MKEIAVLEGIGLHTGAKAKVRIRPAESGSGIVFRAKGEEGWVEFPASPKWVLDTRRRVVLGKDGSRVETVEHLLGVCAGLGLTDAVIEVEGPEIPSGDGSGLFIAQALLEAGLKELDDPQPILRVSHRLCSEEGNAWIAIRPADRLRIRYTFVRSGHRIVGLQTATFTDGDDFLSEIAPARTFGFLEEIKDLWSQGLGLGGSLENALVVGPDGYLTEPRFPNELARHKILDIMGDLSLLGSKVIGEIEGYGSGHSLHWRLCQSIRSAAVQEDEG